MSGERALALQRVFGDVQSLQLHNSNAFILPNGGLDRIERLKANINSFEEYHLRLYELVDGQLQAEVDLYTSPTAINISELIPGSFVSYDNYSVTYRGLSLMNAGAEFIARSRRIAHMPISQIVEGDPDAFYSVMMGYSEIRLACNRLVFSPHSVSFGPHNCLRQWRAAAA